MDFFFSVAFSPTFLWHDHRNGLACVFKCPQQKGSTNLRQWLWIQSHWTHTRKGMQSPHLSCSTECHAASWTWPHRGGHWTWCSRDQRWGWPAGKAEASDLSTETLPWASTFVQRPGEVILIHVTWHYKWNNRLPWFTTWNTLITPFTLLSIRQRKTGGSHGPKMPAGEQTPDPSSPLAESSLSLKSEGHREWKRGGTAKGPRDHGIQPCPPLRQLTLQLGNLQIQLNVL